MVFAVVALALIWKRVVKPHTPVSENAKPLALIALLTSSCIGEQSTAVLGSDCVPGTFNGRYESGGIMYSL